MKVHGPMCPASLGYQHNILCPGDIVLYTMAESKRSPNHSLDIMPITVMRTYNFWTRPLCRIFTVGLSWCTPCTTVQCRCMYSDVYNYSQNWMLATQPQFLTAGNVFMKNLSYFLSFRWTVLEYYDIFCRVPTGHYDILCRLPSVMINCT